MSNNTGKTGGAVAAGHDVTAEAMATILHEGGNAFDAVIAGAMAACVAEPVLASPGGGGFLMALPARSDAPVLYDFFARTPMARPDAASDFYPIEADFGTARQEFHIGAAAVAAPGFARGLSAIHADLASLPFARLAKPAITAATSGVRLTAFQAYLMTVVAPILTASDGACMLFAPGGSILREGDLLRNPGLATTFSLLAEEGTDAFVNGPIGRAIIAQMREHGGCLTAGDLRSYTVEKRQPLRRSMGRTTLFLNPPPSAGGSLIALTLGLFDRLRQEAPSFATAMAAALDICDHTRRKNLYSLAELVADTTLAACLEQTARLPRSLRGTTHMSVIDRHGNAAALTLSNGEGNGYLLDEFGFMLNNMLGEEDLNPGGFHRWPPGTRLSSMMAPMIMRDSDGGVTALGSGGSNRIRSALSQVTARLMAGSDLAQAIEAPRLHLEKGHLDMEDHFSTADRQILLAAFPDHRLWPQRNLFYGGVHAVSCSGTGSFSAAGDNRRAGAARQL